MKLESLPRQVLAALQKLESAGFEANLVGGCVRDLLLEQTPSDFDIATDALPAQVQSVFHACRTIETGLAHGTVTVLFDGMSFEITTYRLDGAYGDHRRPEKVVFTKNLMEDLARRDFTVNAMAMDGKGTFTDPFGGAEDLREKRLRCVGDPDTRFEEDALRILRALRFSSVLDFSIDPAAAASLCQKRELLSYVSRDRLSKELTLLLCGVRAGTILLEYTSVLGVILPELLEMEGFGQQNPHHCYDVLTHTAKVVENIAPLPHLRWAALLHDAAKPPCFTLDEKGIGHFYGHPQRGEILAGGLLRRLCMCKPSIQKICLLVRHHDTAIELREHVVKRWLQRLGPEAFFDLIALKRADNLAQAPAYLGRQRQLDDLEDMARRILEEKACFSLKDMQLDGNRLQELGAGQGPIIGWVLKRLLEQVMDGTLENAPAALEAAAKKLLEEAL